MNKDELETYLAGHSPLSKAYTALDQPAPSADLDAAILDQARRAVAGTPPHAPAARRWMMPASLAAAVLLSFSLVMGTLFEQDRPETVLERPVPTMVRPDSAPAQRVRTGPQLPATIGPHANTDGVLDISATAAPDLRQSSEQRNLMLEKLETIGADFPKAQADDAGRWLYAIEALMEAGELDEARSELERFRETYPDHSIDPELQELSP